MSDYIKSNQGITFIKVPKLHKKGWGFKYESCDG